MVDENGNEVVEPQPEQPLAEAAVTTIVGEATLPYPGPDETAVVYSGTDPIERGGVTLMPDSLHVLPASVAAGLIGRDNIRVIETTEQGWAQFLAMRTKRRAAPSG